MYLSNYTIFFFCLFLFANLFIQCRKMLSIYVLTVLEALTFKNLYTCCSNKHVTFVSSLFLQVHEGICPYRPVKCKHNGCCNLIPSCNLQDHEDNCCPYRPVQCEYCNSPETVGGLPVTLINVLHLYLVCGI